MTTTPPADAKAVLHRYLRTARETLLWKVEGLSERDARTPRTPTGTNLLGLVKHAATVEIDYFGEVFGRRWPAPAEVPWLAAAAAPDAGPAELQAEFFATTDETAEQIVALYRRAWAFADETIDALDLDAPGRVDWWGDDGRPVTLHEILVHVSTELHRHAGHADIVRELADGAVGLRVDNTNMADGLDYAAFTRTVQGIAEQYPDLRATTTGTPGRTAAPTIRQVVLDTTDARLLAEFYREMFGLAYRPGDEPPVSCADPAGAEWLVLRTTGGVQLAFQQVEALAPSTWPDSTVPQQLHLDTTVPDVAELDRQHGRALGLGARLVHDRSDDPEEPLRVYADPAGHPFCIFVS